MAVRCTQSTMISPDSYYTPFVMLGALCLGFVATRSIYTLFMKIVGSWQECFVSTNTRRSEKMWTKLLLCSKPSHYWAKQEIRTTTLHEKPYKGAKKSQWIFRDVFCTSQLLQTSRLCNILLIWCIIWNFSKIYRYFCLIYCKGF